MNELDVKCSKAKHTIRIIKNGFILQQGTRAPNESAVKSAVNSARLPAPIPVRPANTPRHTLPS